MVLSSKLQELLAAYQKHCEDEESKKLQEQQTTTPPGGAKESRIQELTEKLPSPSRFHHPPPVVIEESKLSPPSSIQQRKLPPIPSPENKSKETFVSKSVATIISNSNHNSTTRSAGSVNQHPLSPVGSSSSHSSRSSENSPHTETSRFRWKNDTTSTLRTTTPNGTNSTRAEPGTNKCAEHEKRTTDSSVKRDSPDVAKMKHSVLDRFPPQQQQQLMLQKSSSPVKRSTGKVLDRFPKCLHHDDSTSFSPEELVYLDHPSSSFDHTAGMGDLASSHVVREEDSKARPTPSSPGTTRKRGEEIAATTEIQNDNNDDNDNDDNCNNCNNNNEQSASTCCTVLTQDTSLSETCYTGDYSFTSFEQQMKIARKREMERKKNEASARLGGSGNLSLKDRMKAFSSTA